MDQPEPSYINYDTFVDPDFAATTFANRLVLSTNNPSDSPIDINTPLSRVLFDVQDIDTRIDSLTSRSALPLLEHTRDDIRSATRINQALDAQVATLTEAFDRLHREVIQRHEAAEETKTASERLWSTVKLGRSVSRCLTLGRQLEAQMAEVRPSKALGRRGDDHIAMVRSATSILSLRQIFATARPGGDAEGLDRITVIRTLRAEMVDPAEEALVSKSDQIVGQFSMSSLTASGGDSSASNNTAPINLPQSEDTRSRATSALTTLYLLSPVSNSQAVFEPSRLIAALQEYLRRAITSSLAGLAAGLAALPKLDRTLSEVSARCQNIVALEILLESIKPPQHPMVNTPDAPTPSAGEQTSQATAPSNFLRPLLNSLDTNSLPSYFWRSMASQLTARVQKILRDGGVSARTLRTNRDRVGDAIRRCVDRGSQLPASSLSKGGSTVVRNWEREAAVMVSAVVKPL
ncbi:MAG: hypothetical protein Q9159_005748 [Coniocarpon cinnabarinum]